MVKDYGHRRKIYYILISRNGAVYEVYNYSGVKRQSSNHPLNARNDSERTDEVVDLVTDSGEAAGQKV